MDIENTYKVPKYTWVKWRDAARDAYNRAKSAGKDEEEAVRLAEGTNEYCFKHDIKSGLIPKPHKEVEKPAPTTMRARPEESKKAAPVVKRARTAKRKK